MEKHLVRLLKAEEIECRVSVINEKGLSLLLYKDARVDQRILDETFGAFGWKRSHQSIDGDLYCTVEVLDKETGGWIAKQDVGAAGFTEKEKSRASDSFKRACFNWGIGRELYSAPFIWIPAGEAAIQKKDGRYACNDRFSVASINYNGDREITALAIVNGKGHTVYELKGKASRKAGKEKAPLSGKQMEALLAELARTGVTLEAVKERYRIQEPEGMGKELYDKVMAALSKTKTAQAA